MNTDIQTRPYGGNQGELARVCKQIRREFYERIALLVRTPTRFTATQGIAWPTFRNSWEFNSLIVLPYAGSFDHPLQYDSNGTLQSFPIPRIHLNHCWHEPSKAQLRRWFGANIHGRPAVMSGYSLELTVHLDELVDFADWVLDWLEAVENEEVEFIPTPPHPLHPTRTDFQLLATCYEWTVKANQDYRRRLVSRPSDPPDIKAGIEK